MEEEQCTNFLLNYWAVCQERILYQELDEWKWTKWENINKQYLGSNKESIAPYMPVISESDKRQLDELLENGVPIQIGTQNVLRFSKQGAWVFIRYVIIAEKTENSSSK